MTELSVEHTPIPGLLVLRLPVHGDDRGWFKENWQREKMTALGLPDFGPVQNNVSYNAARGTTRGIHAEPWDKYVSVVAGRVFGAWVDLREGASFGATHTVEIGPDVAVFVPRGVGNSYQALADGTVDGGGDQTRPPQPVHGALVAAEPAIEIEVRLRAPYEFGPPARHCAQNRPVPDTQLDIDDELHRDPPCSAGHSTRVE